MTGSTVGAVILAAGAGERLGGPKLRQGAGGRTFLERVLTTVVAAGCAPVVCVVRAADRDWAAAQVEPAGGAVVVNPAPERGALSSLRLGLDRLGACAGALVAPVDHPFVAAATCRALVGFTLLAWHHASKFDPLARKAPMIASCRMAPGWKMNSRCVI